MTDIIKQSINNEQKTESNNSMNETVISKWNTIDFIDYLDVTNNEVKNLPEEISISTMCTSCKLNTKLNIINIEKYLHLNSDDILSVKVNKERMRTLIIVKNKPQRIKKNDNKLKNNKDI